MNCTVEKTTTTTVSAKLKKLTRFINSLWKFTKTLHKTQKILAYDGLFSALCSDFFVKLFLLRNSDPGYLTYSRPMFLFIFLENLRKPDVDRRYKKEATFTKSFVSSSKKVIAFEMYKWYSIPVIFMNAGWFISFSTDVRVSLKNIEIKLNLADLSSNSIFRYKLTVMDIR